LFSLIVVALSLTACGHSQAASPSIDPHTLMLLAREYGKPSPDNARSSSAASLPVTSPLEMENENAYRLRIHAAFDNKDFDQLEKEAHSVRLHKDRVLGGTWKILEFYDAVSAPAASPATAEDYARNLDSIKAWVAKYPDSATARIALAYHYRNFAWFARGGGYANTVKQDNWKLYAQRVELAKSTIVEAAHLKEKCPFWFELLQMIALDEGWDKPLARELLELGASFEPTYYHYYREYANYLLPKWDGEVGETQAFAEEISQRLPDPQGKIVYFEIATLNACQCDPNTNNLDGLFWPRIKEGYDALQQLYGISTLKANRFAFMAYMVKDRPAAHDAFLLIGDAWQYNVWQTPQSFMDAKAWANTPGTLLSPLAATN
jgi:hypothetical protein